MEYITENLEKSAQEVPKKLAKRVSIYIEIKR
jgi:hypothetical protein